MHAKLLLVLLRKAERRKRGGVEACYDYMSSLVRVFEVKALLTWRPSPLFLGLKAVLTYV
eukprot:6188354-Pleurochrysis_carterae.AAC.2